MTRNKPRSASAAEVARLAGVSRSGVSRTFTPGAYVSAEMREKVLAAAQMLNYSPNAIARSLSKRSTGLVGLVVADLHHPFLAHLVQQLGKQLQEHGFGILTALADSRNIDQLLPRMLSYQVDGVLITVATIDSRLAIALQQAGRPVVLVNEVVDPKILSSVSCDNYAGGVAAARLLWETGHRRIAFISGRADSSNSQDRGRGLRDHLAQRGLSVFAEDVGDYTHSGGVAAARRLLARSTRPDALFCASDLMALGALDVARSELGLSVPGDLAVVGYDNLEVAGWPAYRLTTIDANLTDMTRLAAAMIAEKIKSGQTEVDHHLISPRLIERATTRPTRADTLSGAPGLPLAMH